MDKFEQTVILNEFGIDAPDKCGSCTRLGSLASRLAQAKENKDFLVISTDQDVLLSNMRAQLTDQLKAHYPGADEEDIMQCVENSINNYLSDESRLKSSLIQAGTLLEREDETIENSLNQIRSLLGNCPPEGCTVVE